MNEADRRRLTPDALGQHRDHREYLTFATQGRSSSLGRERTNSKSPSLDAVSGPDPARREHLRDLSARSQDSTRLGVSSTLMMDPSLVCLLGRLPEEVLDRVLVELTEPDDEDHMFMRRARLVCQQWNRLIIPHVFRTIRLRHTLDDDNVRFRPWHEMINSTVVRHAVRRVIVPSLPDKRSRLHDREPNRGLLAGFHPSFIDAIQRIKELPAVNAVDVRFSPHCLGYEPGPDNDDPVETKASRFLTLRSVFEAIELRRQFGAEHGYSEIDSLTLYNLQNDKQPSFVASDLFKSVTSTVKKLQLLITVQCTERTAGWDIYAIERLEYEPHLQTELLPQLAENLNSLTLGFHEPWGVAAGSFDGQGLVFPRLRTLHLIKFVIGHHDQIDWILDQKSITCLRLDQCYIASHLAFNEVSLRTWRTPVHDWQRPPELDSFMVDVAVYFFPGTWEEVFDRIRTGLPELRDFRFDQKGVSNNYHFFNPSDMRADLVKNRYIIFNMDKWEMPHHAIGWVELDRGEADIDAWTEARRGGRAEETREGDLRGLRDLMHALKNR